MGDFTVRKSLENIEEYQVEHVAAKIIVNANENNYPLPTVITERIKALTEQFPFNRYPPVKAENLCAAIASELELDIDNIKIGNGSSELLQIACYVFGGSGKKIAFPYPSFSMYGTYTRLAGSVPAQYPLTEEGYLDADALIDFCRREKPALLIICNPNNPTGNYNALPVVEKVVAAVECPVIVDEAYMEFAGGKDVPPLDMRPLSKLWLIAGSTLGLVGKYSNLMCFRTFSKAYGLAGLRCGYAAGSVRLMQLLGKALLPYHVNAYTLAVAKIVYENKLLYRERTRAIMEERDRMAAYLERLGFRVWPSAANFVAFRAQGLLQEKLAAAYHRRAFAGGMAATVASGKMLYAYLLENGILARDFTEHPLLAGCLRLSVGLPEENKIILEKLTTLCTEVQL